jgi:hypothetical protein
MQLEDLMLCEVGSETQKLHVFPQMWKMDPKDKHIHKNKQYHMQTLIQSVFVIVELLYGTEGRRERKGER